MEKIVVTIKLEEGVVNEIDSIAKEQKRNRSTQIEYFLEKYISIYRNEQSEIASKSGSGKENN